jgi:site-specific DNA recombinase
MPKVPTASDNRATRAAIYTRVSTEDQAETGHSLGEQRRRGHDLIDREGWTHAATYEDAGVSGALASRPQLDRMLADIAAGRIDV